MGMGTMPLYMVLLELIGNFPISGRPGPRLCHWITKLIRMAGINGDASYWTVG